MINREDLQFILDAQQQSSVENDPATGLLAYLAPTLDLLPQSWGILINKAQELSKDYVLPILLDGGKEPVLSDLYDTPNVLLAGTIASGKTQFIYNQILLWLYSYHPVELKLIICRSKPIDYNSMLAVERHFLAKVPSHSSSIAEFFSASATVGSLVLECEDRLDLFQRAAVKTVSEYNKKFLNGELPADQRHRHLPNLVLIMDDLQTFISDEQTVDSLIALSGKNARTGIYLLCLTSQISSRKLTTALRANFNLRIAMKLMSQNKSKRILDRTGAEKLIQPGELLYQKYGHITQAKQLYLDYESILRITSFIGHQSAYFQPFPLPELSAGAPQDTWTSLEDRDPLFEQAARLIVLHQQGSTSLIQRKLKLGYNRTGRIIDQLEAAGIVGPFEGSKAREVRYADEYSLEQYLSSLPGNQPMKFGEDNLSSSLPISPATIPSSGQGDAAARDRHKAPDPITQSSNKVPQSRPKKKASLYIMLVVLAIILYLMFK